MATPIFYINPNSINDNTAFLDKTESHHAHKVMRLKKGAVIIMVDGLGNGYRGEIMKIGRTNPTEIKIHTQIRNFGEPDVKLTLACGLSTGHKFDTTIEKGTELGVSRFVPLFTEKSKIKLEDPKRIKSKQNRHKKVALAAIKQCQRSYIPEVCLPVSFDEYLKEIDPESVNLIFHPSKTSRSIYDIEFNDEIKRINLLIGPESGFSDEEIDKASDKSVIPVTIGQRILRTETAGPVICGIIMHQLGQLR